MSCAVFPNSFNGAGVFRPRKFADAQANYELMYQLQWGRGLSTPEMHGFRAKRERLREASMGPGSFDPGNVATGGQIPPDCDQASMGPGSFDPGNDICVFRCRGNGSRFNGAGVFRPRKCPAKSSSAAPTSPLQWGRGLSTPEI